jgi:ligand-binding sensor domain-containing protein/signal transduction histidine kinase
MAIPMLRRVAKLIVGGVLCLNFAARPFAGETDQSLWLARSWQTDEGLPDNTISGVAQIGGAYLWLGTQGGLVSFDGLRFRELPIVPFASVPNRVVRAMYLDSAARLWLGMDRGALVRLDASGVQTLGTRNGLPDLTMSIMAEDATGSLWIAYANAEGLVEVRDGNVIYHRKIDGALSGGSWWIISDSERRIWFSKAGSIGRMLDGQAKTLFTVSDSNARLAPARGGGIWIFADGKLFREGDEASGLVEKGALQGPQVVATALFEDSTGAIWIGTAARGLIRFDGTRFATMPGSHRSITCLTEDSEGNIWAGTAGGGINRLRPRAVTLLNLQSGLPFESIRSVCEDTSGVLWMTTQNGALVRQEGTRWITVSSLPAWNAGPATCVAADSKGGVWIGTEERGLLYYRDGDVQSVSMKDGLASSFVRSLMVGPRGELWIALDGPNTLQRLQDGKFTTFQAPGTRFIRAMAEDTGGRLWIGTSDGQLLSVEGEKLVPEPNTLQRPHSIRCLAVTADGSLWIGYAGIGMGRLKDGKLQRVSNIHGLLDSYISQIVADEQGRLWLGSNRGIFHVRIHELEDLFAGRAERVRSIAYGKGEGLPSLQASFDFCPGAFRSRAGDLWMPTGTGLAMIRPDQIRDDPRPPTVLIEHIAVDTRSLPPDETNPMGLRPLPWTNFLAAPVSTQLKIPPRHFKVEFDFTALSFTAPENVHFRYRLDGVDPDWVEAGGVRRATYSLLPVGDYRFQVTACNHKGIWSPVPASLGFIVLPFFWQTWWFRGSMLLAFSILLVAVARVIFLRRVRTQMRALEQQAVVHKERARIAKDIHDDLGASLTEISLLTELAQHDTTPGKSAEYFDRIAGTSRHVVKSLDEIVWAVNPRNDTLAGFIDYTAQFALDHLRLADIRCRLDLPEVAPERELTADVRHNLFLATKEALHNVVKHSKATEAWVRVAVSREGLRIIVEDNGAGFELVPETPNADGLRNMEHRLRDIGGAMKVRSHLHHGSKVIIELPWPKI